MAGESSSSLKYPVQPTFITVRELRFISHRPPAKTDQIDQSNIEFKRSISEFIESTKKIQITLHASLGCEDGSKTPHLPFFLQVAITGEFFIADTFPREKIAVWANVNAPFVLYPYLRERICYLSVQGGYPPVILPLLQIPTFKLSPKDAGDLVRT
jgi:preprotein translocase subunit SecB